MTQLFISYANEDSRTVEELHLALEEAGYSVWFYERDSVPIIKHYEQTSRAINECDAFIILITRHSIKSHQVDGELVLARELNKPIVPILKGVSYEECMKIRPVWRQLISARVAISVPGSGIRAIIPPIIKGLEWEGTNLAPNATDLTSRSQVVGTKTGSRWLSTSPLLKVGAIIIVIALLALFMWKNSLIKPEYHVVKPATPGGETQDNAQKEPIIAEEPEVVVPKEPPGEPPFRVRYITLGGQALQFIADGKLDESMETAVGGQPFIVLNSTFREFQDISEKSEYPVHPFYMRLLYNDDYVHAEGEDYTGSFLLEAPITRFSGTNGQYISDMFSPDPEYNIDWNIRLYDKLDSMKNLYSFESRSFPNGLKEGEILIRDFSLWKYVGLNDFQKLVTGKNSSRQEVFEYLFREGKPEDFLVADVPRDEGCGGGPDIICKYLFMHAAIIENVTASTIYIKNFVAKENKQSRLRTYDSESTDLISIPEEKYAFYPMEALKPDERILIPLDLVFKKYHQYQEDYSYLLDNENPKGSEMDSYNSDMDRNTREVLAGISDDPDIKWISFMDYMHAAPQITISKDRFIEEFSDDDQFHKSPDYLYGPSWEITGIEVGEYIYPFRKYDSNLLLAYAGYQTGSCPYVYVWDNNEAEWAQLAHILYDRKGKLKEGFEEIRLDDFNGKIMLKEIEPEISYIDYVYLRIIGPDGIEKTIDATYPNLCSLDGNYEIMETGDELILDFTYLGELPGSTVYIGAVGYYELL